MARYIIVACALIFISIIQMSVITVFFGENIAPDLVLVVVVLWVILFGFSEKWGRIMAFGIIFDLMAYSTVGARTLAMVLAAFFVSFLTKRFLSVEPVWKYSMMAIFVLVATLLNHLAINIVENSEKLITGNAFSPVIFLLGRPGIYVQAFFNIILSILLYWPVVKAEKLLEHLTLQGSLGRIVKK